MSVQQEKFKQIADVLRSFNASIKKIKPSDFASKFAELHEAALLRGHENGKIAEQGSFWDTYQQYGMRTGWAYAFYGRGWTDETYNPKYPISTSGAFSQMFGYSNITDTVVPLNFAYQLNKRKLVHWLKAIRSVILRLYHTTEWPNKTQIPESYPQVLFQ